MLDAAVGWAGMGWSANKANRDSAARALRITRESRRSSSDVKVRIHHELRKLARIPIDVILGDLVFGLGVVALARTMRIVKSPCNIHEGGTARNYIMHIVLLRYVSYSQ